MNLLNIFSAQQIYYCSKKYFHIRFYCYFCIKTRKWDSNSQRSTAIYTVANSLPQNRILLPKPLYKAIKNLFQNYEKKLFVNIFTKYKVHFVHSSSSYSKASTGGCSRRMHTSHPLSTIIKRSFSKFELFHRPFKPFQGQLSGLPPQLLSFPQQDKSRHALHGV